MKQRRSRHPSARDDHDLHLVPPCGLGRPPDAREPQPVRCNAGWTDAWPKECRDAIESFGNTPCMTCTRHVSDGITYQSCDDGRGGPAEGRAHITPSCSLLCDAGTNSSPDRASPLASSSIGSDRIRPSHGIVRWMVDSHRALPTVKSRRHRRRKTSQREPITYTLFPPTSCSIRGYVCCEGLSRRLPSNIALHAAEDQDRDAARLMPRPRRRKRREMRGSRGSRRVRAANPIGRR